jgi:hypothetical protein
VIDCAVLLAVDGASAPMALYSSKKVHKNQKSVFLSKNAHGAAIFKT